MVLCGIVCYFEFNLSDQFPYIIKVCLYSRDLSDLDEFSHDYGIQLCPVLEVAPSVQFEEISQLYPVFQDFLSCFS